MTGDRERDLLKAANMLMDARRTGDKLVDLPEELRPVDVEEIYAVHGFLARAYGDIGGWKIGAGSAEATPLFAPMPKNWMTAGGTMLSGERFMFRGLEAEIAFLVGEDLPPRETPYTREEVLAAMASCHPAIEELESAFVDPLTTTRTCQLADLQMHGGFIYGPAFADWRDVDFSKENVTLAGERPDFLPDTAHIREADWTVAPLPADLLDRRVEITGPVDRKMIINALNSGAKVFMADFEDSTTPTWENMLDGQLNHRDAVRRTITFSDPATGKQYALKKNPAVLFVRARGWHLEERHVWVDGEAMSGSIFDFALYLFHNAKELVARGSGPYFYLPKIESHLEARLWNDIFVRAEPTLGLTPGTIKGTVLIETILATFEMDEILYELRDHSAGLNCGRWDYIFSFIKKLAGDESLLLPDRGQVT